LTFAETYIKKTLLLQENNFAYDHSKELMMRKPLSYFTAVVMFLMLVLALSVPITERSVKADGQTLQEKCDECSIRNNERFEQCVAINGQDHTPCYDKYNEGVVICYRNFCEQ
jgi:hypothetical protein